MRQDAHAIAIESRQIDAIHLELTNGIELGNQYLDGRGRRLHCGFFQPGKGRTTLALVTMQQIFQGLRLGWGQLRRQGREDLAFCLWTDLGDDFVNGTFRRKENTLFA